MPVADREGTPIFLRSYSLLFLCCFAAMQSLGQAAQPDDQPRKISGTVIDAVTKAPIPRALVVSSDNRMAKLTDGEGHFEFTMPRDFSGASGSVMVERSRLVGCHFWLQARKPGFLDSCPESGGASESSGDDLTIVLVPEAIILGRVTLPNSDALPGTTVQLYSKDVVDGLPKWIPGTAAQTNSAGEFRFAELPAGEYKLLTHERAEDDLVANVPGNVYGYPPVFYGGAADFASAPPIHLSAGQAVEADFSAVRRPYYSVHIPVSNGDNSPGIQVTVSAQAGPGYSLGYNQGVKRIEGYLPNGDYVVEATVFGATSASGTVNLKVNGAASEGSPMTLIPVSSIRVDVKEEFTDPTWRGESSWNDGKRTFQVRGPRVYLQANLENADDFQEQRGSGGMRQPNGPSDESLALENVAPGRYWLRLSTSRGYVASAHMGEVDLLHRPLVVTPGLSAPIEVEMRDDAAEINGTVTGMASSSAGSDSQPTGTSAWVYCVPLPDSSGQFQRLLTSADGHFAQAMMAPGAYRILAFASRQDRLPYRDPEAMKAYETKGQVVHLEAGQKLSVQVPLITDSDSSEK